MGVIILALAGLVVQVAVVVKIIPELLPGEQAQAVKATTAAPAASVRVEVVVVLVLWVKMFLAQDKAEPAVRVVQAQ